MIKWFIEELENKGYEVYFHSEIMEKLVIRKSDHINLKFYQVVVDVRNIHEHYDEIMHAIEDVFEKEGF